jgi:hypothetical protein
MELKWPEIAEEEDTVPMGLSDFCHTDFNDVRMSSDTIWHGDAMPIIDTAYPRIYTTINLLWGSQELQNCFTRWLLTDQDGRQGWPKVVNDALLFLANKHSSTYGYEPNVEFGNWRDEW